MTTTMHLEPATVVRPDPDESTNTPRCSRLTFACACLSILVAGARPASAQYGELDPPPEVEVLYDNLSIPHIFTFELQPAKADEHVFYGLGYTQMRDFPVQTLDNIFSSCGRYAEAWGEPAALAEIPTRPNEARDRFLRHWELPERAVERKAALVADDVFGLLPLLEAYVAGVNDGRSWWLSHPAALEKLVGTPGCSACELFIDPVPAVLIAWNNLGSARAALEHFLGSTVTVEDVLASGLALSSGLYGGGGGTNAWAARTAAGGTLVMNDSHLPFNTGRFSLYPVQISGGNYDVTGVTVPGFPCVVVGFNQNMAWATSVGGSSQIPNPAETGLSTLTVGGTPVVSNTWRATLEPDTPLRFEFGTEEAALVSATKEFLVWDGPGTTTHSTIEEEMWYAPAESGAVTSRYPLVVGNYSQAMTAPVGGETIRFQQRAPLAGAAAWEHMLAMGLAQSTASVVSDVLPYARYGFGGGINLLVADRSGDLHYSLLAFVPVQGAGAVAQAPWEESAAYELDGTEPDQRWIGIHPPEEMPHFDSSSGGEERWISCNSTAHFVGPTLTQSFPTYILEDAAISTWRQQRADELLRGPSSPPIDRATSESFAVDVQDTWMAALWPLFEQTHAQRLLGHPGVDAFVAFVNANKLEGGTDPFLATTASRVTVYTSLLRDAYELEILSLQDCGVTNPPGCLTEPQKRLGFDAAFVRPDPVTFGSSGNWIPNLDAMEQALETVAALYVNTTSPGGPAPGGLDNMLAVSLLDAVLSAPLAVNPSPWAALRSLEPHDVRWGMVNVLSTTAHAFPFMEAAAPCSFFTAAYLSNFYPPLSPAPIDRPFNRQQRPAVWPLAGVQDSSLFAVNTMRYRDSVYPCNGTRNLFFRTLRLGSAAPFSVEFPTGGGPPQASFMAALGATNHVRAIPEFGIGAGDRWLPTPSFVARTWQTLHTEYAYLDQPANNIHRLTLTGP